jgi:hypothetical protein
MKGASENIRSQWTQNKYAPGRSEWFSPDGKIRILDQGRSGNQRYQVFYREGEKWLEDNGWPSFKGAVEYVTGKRLLRQHPMGKR